MRLRASLLPAWIGAVALIHTATGQLPPSNTGVDPALVQQAISAFYHEHAELPHDGSGPWIKLIGKAGSPQELRKLLNQVAAEGFDLTATISAVDSLAEASLVRGLRPAAQAKPADPLLDPDYQTAVHLLFAPNVELQAAAARLAGAWKMGPAADRLAELAASPDTGVRLAAFEALRSIGGKTALTFFAVLARPDQRAETRRRALVAIAEISLDAATMQAAEVFPLIDNEADALETWRGLLKVERAADAFSVRLAKDLPKPVLTAGIRAAQELGEEGEPLLKVLTRELESSKANGKQP
jgi:hypothetical protein